VNASYILLAPFLAIGALAVSMAEPGMRERFARPERVEDGSSSPDQVDSVAGDGLIRSVAE
jgi:hypothetical protein